MSRKECIAMLLAGGQGSRLGELTSSIAKPAVSFAGKYRIIDFSLSNCVNSGINTVGVLTQYRPTALNKYIGTGAAWDMDVMDGGVNLLPPYATQTGGEWYDGTADAIYHNIDYIASYDPKYVLILSGDHIYKMNYGWMIAEHKEHNADLTVSVITVPWEETSRFGIMSTDENKRIVKFEEKPKEADSNLASMGIYVFSWPVLLKALLEDHANPESEHDFGKNIIPKLLSENARLFAYTFSDYWMDVGTIDSYYQSQMDMMKDNPPFNLYDSSWHIFSNSNLYPPHYVGEKANLSHCMVCNGCIIKGDAKDSILGSGSKVDEGSSVEDSILLPGAEIGKNCRVRRAIINEGVRIKDGSDIGEEGGKITVIGSGSGFSGGDAK